MHYEHDQYTIECMRLLNKKFCDFNRLLLRGEDDATNYYK